MSPLGMTTVPDLAFTPSAGDALCLVTPAGEQVMMAWEQVCVGWRGRGAVCRSRAPTRLAPSRQPYMEALVDALAVDSSCDVLEIGFGLGYSATRIQAGRPRNHVIVECSPVVLAAAARWAAGRPGVTLVPGRWQDTLHTLGSFDRVFFDDYPLEGAGPVHRGAWSRWHDFLDEVFAGEHARAGCRITGYLARPDVCLDRYGCTVAVSPFAVAVARDCKYFEAPTAYVPVITAVEPDADFRHSFASRLGCGVAVGGGAQRLLAAVLARQESACEGAGAGGSGLIGAAAGASTDAGAEAAAERLAVLRRAAGRQ